MSSSRQVLIVITRHAGNAIVDGIAASNYVVKEDHGLVLDAMASERFKSMVRRAGSSSIAGSHTFAHPCGLDQVPFPAVRQTPSAHPAILLL